MRTTKMTGFSGRLAQGVLPLALLSSCVVSQGRYDTLAQQHQAEARARGEAVRKVALLENQLDELQATLEKTEARAADELDRSRSDLEQRTETLAEVEYQHSLTQREREEASAQVTQLREELARVAAHLGAFAEARDELTKERDVLSKQIGEASDRLESLEAEMHRTKIRSILVRDVSLLLHRPLQDQTVKLGVTSDAVVLTTRTDALFAAKSTKLSAKGRRLVAQIGKALKARDEQIELQDLIVEGEPAERKTRLRAVADLLTEEGVAAERIALGRSSPVEQGEPKPGSKSTEEAKGDSTPSQQAAPPAAESRVRLWIRPSGPQTSATRSGQAARASASAEPAREMPGLAGTEG
jgi:flagellar motor protein MotB